MVLKAANENLLTPLDHENEFESALRRKGQSAIARCPLGRGAQGLVHRERGERRAIHEMDAEAFDGADAELRAMTARPKFQQRTFRLIGKQQVDGRLRNVRNKQKGSLQQSTQKRWRLC